MSAPLMVLPIIISNIQNAENQRRYIESYDPIRAGFGDFAEQPSAQRNTLVRAMFDVALKNSQTFVNTESYIDNVASAVINTATSTGLIEVSPALLFRSIKKHLEHENMMRLYNELDTIRDYATAYQASLPRRNRNDFNKAISSHDLGVTGLVLGKISAMDIDFNGSYIREAAIQDTLQDIPNPTEMMEDIEHIKDQPISAHYVARQALTRFASRIITEKDTIVGIFDTMHQDYPGFGIQE